MSIREFQAANLPVPIKNTASTIALYSVTVGDSSATIDLATIFGNLESGDYLSIAAVGCTVFVAFGTSAGSIDDTARGAGLTQCFPVFENTVLPGIPYTENLVLHHKAASGDSGALHIARSSLPPNATPENWFKAPGVNAT